MPRGKPKGHTKENDTSVLIKGEIQNQLFEHYFIDGWAVTKCSAWLENNHNIKIIPRALQNFIQKEKELRQDVCRSVLRDKLEVSVGAELERIAAELEYWRNEGVVKHSQLSEERKPYAHPSIWQAIEQQNKLRIVFFRATTGLVQNKEFDLDEFADAVKQKILKSDKE